MASNNVLISGPNTVSVNLKELGERAVIDEIWSAIGQKIVYDDCAFVEHGAYYQLFTTDFVGEGSHFVPAVEPYKLGEFIAGVNISDIAAMGGIPEFFMLSAFMPRNKDLDFIKGVVKGIKHVLDKYNIAYLGGDLKESPITGFAGFAIGKVEKNKIIRRIGARVGDSIYITAPLGKNAAYYYLWKKGLEKFEKVLEITPRVNEGRVLAGHAHAGMDTSDGLISGLYQLQELNNLGFDIQLEDVPLHPKAEEVMEEFHIPARKLLEFGGDYELLYTSSEHVFGYEIGKVVEKKLDYGGKGYESFSKTLDQA